jgi:hypothetical protein
MSTPTPTQIPNTGLGNIFSFIGNSTNQVQLLIIGGLIITIFIVISYLRKKRMI